MSRNTRIDKQLIKAKQNKMFCVFQYCLIKNKEIPYIIERDCRDRDHMVVICNKFI
jgi:hypothetical protein